MNIFKKIKDLTFTFLNPNTLFFKIECKSFYFNLCCPKAKKNLNF